MEVIGGNAPCRTGQLWL